MSDSWICSLVGAQKEEHLRATHQPCSQMAPRLGWSIRGSALISLCGLSHGLSSTATSGKLDLSRVSTRLPRHLSQRERAKWKPYHLLWPSLKVTQHHFCRHKGSHIRPTQILGKEKRLHLLLGYSKVLEEHLRVRDITATILEKCSLPPQIKSCKSKMSKELAESVNQSRCKGA